MESIQRTETNKFAALRSSKWAKGATAMLLSASLLLAACGDSPDPVADDGAVAPAATTPAVATPIATDEVVEEDTDTTTETEVITETETIVDTEVTTETIETDVVTETVVMTDTNVTVGAAEVVDTEVTTETSTVEGSNAMTDTEGMGDTDTTTSTSAIDTTDAMPLMGVSGVSPQQYVRASTLLDYDFENRNDEVSGDLEDLLIDLSTGRVLFAAIEYGGILDLGDKDIVVPLNAFTIGEDGELVLDIDEAALESYPDVGNDWPNLDDELWDDDVNTYWTETGIDVGPGYDTATTNVAWASDLLGYNIADLGFGAGSILDILVNLGTGHAPYLIVDYGEGLDTDPYIIPLSAYDMTDWSTEFAYGPDFTPDLLENAPRYDQEMYPDGSPLDTDFGDRLESTWNDLGFSNDLNRDGEID